jgi:bifunctional DNA-binding transcriptional regulator/antitoxin component of YhaV-PrlF toxin-antitoxin module
MIYFTVSPIASLCSMTTTISSRGQTVIPAEFRARHHLTQQSRLGSTMGRQSVSYL